MNTFQMLINRELNGSVDKRRLYGETLKSVLESHSFHCCSQQTFHSAVHHLEIDPVDRQFLLSGNADGRLMISEMIKSDTPSIETVASVLCDSEVNRCQWYPIDNGMMSATCPKSLCLYDTNTTLLIDKYDFHKKLYWSHWNTNKSTIIAVACASSAIRLIDIRCGDSLQQITIKPALQKIAHDVTRVCWMPFDPDCLIAGDSLGYLHVYDMRYLAQSVCSVHNDQLVCEPITCLTTTSDNMSLVSSHGSNNLINLWHFKGGQITNSNVNFQVPSYGVKPKKKGKSEPVFLRCQMHVTDSLIFAPSSGHKSANDVFVYCIDNGLRVENLSSSNKGTFNSGRVNCVTGDECVIYSGGDARINVWTPKINIESQKIFLESRYHQDDWSDND